ncbi:MAG: DUF928 domain-containing protein [Spirulinaceae cyanobacterium]
MFKLQSSLSRQLFFFIFTGLIAVGSSLSQSAFAQATPSDDNLVPDIKFQPPGEPAPQSGTGGASRGDIQFKVPGKPAPESGTGGASRGDVEFRPVGEPAPRSGVGGGSRGELEFRPVGEPAPSSSIGGGSRGDLAFRPVGKPAPGRTVGGGSRSDEELAKVIPLLPSNKYGYTATSRPTFHVYLPESSVKQIFFSIQDKNKQSLYQTTLEVSGQGGILSFTLPEDAPELELGEDYQWFFATIEPKGILRPDNYGVTGWVKRVAPPTEAIANAELTSVQRAALYANAGIWYDTLSLIASAKLEQPNNSSLQNEWQDLLQQVDLEAVATQPLTEQL